MDNANKVRDLLSWLPVLLLGIILLVALCTEAFVFFHFVTKFW